MRVEAINRLITRWTEAAEKGERLATDEDDVALRSWRHGQAETYRQCVADLRAASPRPGGN